MRTTVECTSRLKKHTHSLGFIKITDIFRNEKIRPNDFANVVSGSFSVTSLIYIWGLCIFPP